MYQSQTRFVLNKTIGLIVSFVTVMVLVMLDLLKVGLMGVIVVSYDGDVVIVFRGDGIIDLGVRECPEVIGDVGEITCKAGVKVNEDGVVVIFISGLEVTQAEKVKTSKSNAIILSVGLICVHPN